MQNLRSLKTKQQVYKISLTRLCSKSVRLISYPLNFQHRPWSRFNINAKSGLLRKEVIQPHLPIRLPCYDFTPIIYPTFDGWLQSRGQKSDTGCQMHACFILTSGFWPLSSGPVTPPASGVANFRGVTGGVYKARERIHRSVLTCDY